MGRFSTILLISFVLVASFGGCVRRQPSARYHRNYYEQETSSDDFTLPTRSSIKRARSQAAGSLPSRVQSLANQVERAYKRGRVSSKDIENWSALLIEYYMEYGMTLGSLTDQQCESIEYNVGRIAGYIYKDTVNPLLEEMEDIADDLDDYETRSKKWEGASDKGFEDASGIKLDDIDW